MRKITSTSKIKIALNAETGRMNPDSEIIITVYLDVCEGASREDIERTLRFTEEEINDNCK